MNTPLADVCCARFPAAAVVALAELRCRSDVSVIRDGDHLWLRWDGADDEVLRCVLPLPGVVLHVRRADGWHRFGELLPCDGPPEASEVMHLDRVLFPAPLQAILPTPRELRPVALRLIRDGQARPATALRCSLSAVEQWADGATSDQISAVRAARCGARVLLLGSKLPPLPESERFWGRRVLTPLGFRAAPALPESALAEVLGLQAEEIAVLDQGGVEVLSENVFEPLTRAGVRLAGAERTK